MAIVQKASNSLASVASFSPALTGVTAGNTLVLLVAASAFTDTTPTDSSGQLWAKVGYLNNSGCQVAVYWLQSANAGTHNLTVAHGGSAYPSWSLVEIPPCSAVDVFGTLASGSNTITTLSTNAITTTNANDAVFVLFAADVTTGSTNAGITDPPTGYASVFAEQNTSARAGCEFGYKEVSSIGSQSATWTFAADTTGSLYAAVAVAFKLGTAGTALAGDGATKVVGTGALTTKAQFSGGGTTKASGSGTLTIGSGLIGGGSTRVIGSGTLTTKSQFAGGGTTSSTGSGNLSTNIALAGGGTTKTSGSGTLTTSAAFSANGSTAASGAGTLTTRSMLAGAGTTRVQGSGTFSLGAASKNVVGKTWSITPSFDGLLYSAWPNGDKPAGYQTSPKIVGTDIRAITLVNNYNGQGSWFRVLGYGLGLDSLKGTSSGVRVFLRDPLGDNAWHEVYSYLKVGKSVSYNYTQLMSVWVQVGALGGSQVSGRALDLKVTVNGVDSNVMVGRMVNQGPRDFYFVDNVVGNDSTGVKNDPTHPYRYVQNASGGTYLGIWAVWKPGDTIVPRGTGTAWTDQLASCNNRWAQFPWGPAFPVTTGADPVGQGGAVGKGYYTFYGYPLEDVHAVFNNGGGIQGTDSARAQAGSGNYVQVANFRMETQGGSARDAGGVNCQAGSDHWQIGCIEFGPWIAGASAVLNCSGIGGQTSNTEVIDCYVHDVQGLSDLQNHGYYFGGVSGGTGYNNATFNTKLRYCVAVNCTGGSNFQFYWQEGSNSNYMTGNAMEHCYADNSAKYNYNLGDSTVSMDVFDCIGVRAGFSALRLHPPSGQTAAINIEACTFVDWNTSGGTTTQPFCVVNEGFASTGSIKFRHIVMRAKGGRGGAYTPGWYTNNGASDTAITASQNVYYDPDGVTTSGWSIDAAAIVGNPVFTAETSGNYTLNTGSVALDAVTTARAITVSDDFYGIARPQGVRDDIGACEGVGT